MVNYRLNGVILLVIFPLIIFAFFGCKSQSVSFIPLIQFDRQDTVMFNGKQLFNKRTNYIIVNYKDKPSLIKAIDSMAFEKAKDIKDYEHFTIFFYKASDKTNIQHLKKNPKDFDRYTGIDDLVYQYSWIGGVFSQRYKYKDGEMIEPKTNIRVE